SSLEVEVLSKTPSPTPREMEILKVIWELGPSSVRSVYEELRRGERVAYNTIQTLLRIMEDKGLVEHHVSGRTFVYSPCYSRDEIAVRFLDRVVDGAVDQLVLSLMRSERIKPGEFERMQMMISDAHRTKSGNRSGRTTRAAGEDKA